MSCRVAGSNALRVEAETKLSVPSSYPLAGLQHCWTHLLAAFL